MALVLTSRPRSTSVSGFGYVGAWVAGLLLAPAAPAHDASAAEVSTFYGAHGGAVILSAALVHGLAGVFLARLAFGVAAASSSTMRRVVLGTGLAAAALSVAQFALAVVGAAGLSDLVAFRGIDFLDVVKLALLAAFAWVATSAVAGPRWLRGVAAVLVPLLLVGSAGLVGVGTLYPVLELSLLVLLAWAASIGLVAGRRG